MALNPAGITWDDAPTPGGFYMGPDPLKAQRDAEDEERKRRAAANSDISTGISVRGEGRQVANDAFNQASQLREKFSQWEPVKNYGTVIRYYGIAAKADDTTAGDQTLINSFAKMQNPDSTVMQGEFDSAAQNDTEIAQIKTKLQREFGWDGAGRLSPEARGWMLNEMQSIAAGSNAAYRQAREYYGELAKRNGFDPFDVIGPHAGEPFLDDIKDTRLKLKQGDNVNAGGRGTGYSGYDEENGLFGNVSYEGETDEQRKARELAQQRFDTRGEGDIARVARQGVTLGLSDEVGGAAYALGRGLTGDFNFAQNYRVGNAADDLLNDRARANLGWGGTALEMAGGGGALRGVANMGMAAARNLSGPVTRGAIQSQMARTAGIEGAAAGAIGGFGYGEGTAQSLGGAAIGAGAGGLLGYGAQRLGNSFANRPQMGVDQRALAQAGQAEDIAIPNAMMNPRSNNSVTRTDATMFGGPRLQQGMQGVADSVEGRVNALGGNGQAMLNQADQIDRVALGQRAQAAAERQIERTGQVASRRYNHAERLAGNARVTPQESLRRVDAMIGQFGGQRNTGVLDASGNPIMRTQDGTGLAETANVNSAELSFLHEIKSDLSNDLSVGGLRRMRTKLRKKISKGDLVFGEDEANVLAIMDGAADDIRNGLVAQGRGAAAKAFDAADKGYRARMEYISGTLQKMIGKRQDNMPAERVADNLLSIARNDAAGLRKFYASLDPSEAEDVAATLAQTLGRNQKGEFSLPAFVKETGRMDDRTVRTVFGARGAESVKNLRLIAREADRVQSSMNSRKSGSGVAMRDVLLGLFTGGGAGGLGVVAGAGTLGTAAAAGAGLAASGVVQVLSARALMSTRLSRWILRAPRTQNRAAVNRHLTGLGAIAGAEPAIANDIGVIRGLFGANDNVAGLNAAARDREED